MAGVRRTASADDNNAREVAGWTRGGACHGAHVTLLRVWPWLRARTQGVSQGAAAATLAAWKGACAPYAAAGVEPTVRSACANPPSVGRERDLPGNGRRVRVCCRAGQAQVVCSSGREHSGPKTSPRTLRPATSDATDGLAQPSDCEPLCPFPEFRAVAGPELVAFGGGFSALSRTCERGS